MRFVDPNFSAQCKLATHILGENFWLAALSNQEVIVTLLFSVFYLRTLKGEISLPIAWYPTQTTSPENLCLTFWELLGECELRRIRIHTVVADGLSTNRKFFKLPSGQSKVPLNYAFTAPNPYGPGRPIFLCSDPPHLLKVCNIVSHCLGHWMLCYSDCQECLIFIKTWRNKIYEQEREGYFMDAYFATL